MRSISRQLLALTAFFAAISLASSSAVAADDVEADIRAALAKLPEADPSLALSQRWCAVEQENRLESMGTPIKVVLDGKPVFLYCAGCKKIASADPKATVKAAETLKRVNAFLAKLAPTDRMLAEAQRICAVENENLLGAMGAPVKVTIEGAPVFLCCQGCEDAAKAKPKETLAAVEKLKKTNGAK